MIKQHVAKAHSANTHPAKLLVLSGLLKELFGVRLEELIPGIESKLGSKLWGLRGSADLIFSNVVFEIKVDLHVERDDAEKKLIKYFQVLHEKEPDRKHIGIATDVIEFSAYTPIIKEGQVVDLNRIGSVNIAEASSAESVLWLDSFVFSKPKIRPSAMDLRWRFGPDSPTYCICIEGLTSLWEEVKKEKDVGLKLDLWASNMEIVYGGRPEVSAFIDHTYLVTLVKLIVYLRLSGDNLVREDRLVRALTGEYFASYGIANLTEEDFFAWLLHPRIQERTLRVVEDIAKELLRYDLSQLDEDFFKEIYQEIVKRSERHRIGEYYTPEWLVELTLEESMELWQTIHQGTPRILDPGCGSGTFLCNAIHIMKEHLLKEGKDPTHILDIILDNVVGVDINPLAVVIARANYVVALGELLQLGKRIIVPIYVADSIKMPRVILTLTEKGKTSVYEFTIEVPYNNKVKQKIYAVQIPQSVASQKLTLNEVVEGYKAAIHSYRIRKNRKEAFEVFGRSQLAKLSGDELEVLRTTLNTILGLMDAGLDAIWVFMLSNIYAPITLAQCKFDMLVGNPPWIAMRYVENISYQDFLKREVLSYELLSSGQVYQFSNIETATLFFCKSSDIYLEKDGIISFVMPRSVLTGALHHINFKQLRKPKMKLAKILDLEDVSPIFNVPSCVLIALKGETTSYPVVARKFAGNLPEKNVRLLEAKRCLLAKDYMYSPPTPLGTYSVYYNLVKSGAYLCPRCFYFIDFDVHPILGIDKTKPAVKTSDDIQEKEPWKGTRLQGNVEANFIFATLIGVDLVSFGYVKLRPVVLPVERANTGYRLLDVNELRNKGYTFMAKWLEAIQKIWETRRTKKSQKLFLRLIDRIDYQGLLSNQSSKSRYVVVYNKFGTNLVSCVIDKKNLQNFQLGTVSIAPVGFLAENATQIFATDDLSEAHYLCSILNSNTINDAIKPYQPRGSFGERDITRLPFKLAVEKFDKSNPLHVDLARLSEQCHSIIASFRFTKKSTSGLRTEAKEAIANEIERIDALVSKLLVL